MLWIVLGCTGKPPIVEEKEDNPPDILFVTIDTLRADRLGAYGDTLAKTPNLDRLAAEGWLFTEQHAITPLTLPSHTTMMTGLLPREHGIRDNAGFTLADQHQTIAETLSDENYSTGAFVSAYVLSHTWGLDQGFDLYHDPFHPQDLLEVAAFGEAQLPGAEVLNAATQWWRTQDTDQPKFAWVHLYEPHTPWEPPTGWEGDPYRGEVAKVDHLLGNLLELAEDAWIVVTSDHGEGLWDHGEREHGVLLGRSVTRVPLIIRPPGGLEGTMRLEQPKVPSVMQRPKHIDDALDLSPITGPIEAAKIVEKPTSSLDLAATLAEMAGVSFVNGQSLFAPREKSIAYAETYFPYFHYGWHPLAMAQNADQRIESGVTQDTFHPHSLAVQSQDPELFEQLREAQGEVLPKKTESQLTASEELALQSLGYQTDFVFPSLERSPDPRVSVDILQQIQVAEQQPLEEAIASLDALVEQHPTMLDIQLSLAYLESARGDFESALNRCVDVLRQNPDHSVALNNAVILANKLKRVDVAIAFANRMHEANPQDVRPFRYLAAVYAEKEDPSQVIVVTNEGLEIEPTDPNLNYLKGLAHAFLKQDDQAVVHLQKAQAYGSRASDVSLWLGITNERQGQIDVALEHYQQAINDAPLDPRPAVRAGLMLVEADQCSRALPLLINVAKRLQGLDPNIQAALKKCAPSAPQSDPGLSFPQ